MNMIDQEQLRAHLEQMQTVTLLLLEKASMVPSAQEVRGHRYVLPRLTCLSLETQGEKNNGFDVLYHNMKHGQISSKELTEFIRER